MMMSNRSEPGALPPGFLVKLRNLPEFNASVRLLGVCLRLIRIFLRLCQIVLNV